jgi:hypothetical protein
MKLLETAILGATAIAGYFFIVKPIVDANVSAAGERAQSMGNIETMLKPIANTLAAQPVYNWLTGTGGVTMKDMMAALAKNKESQQAPSQQALPQQAITNFVKSVGATSYAVEQPISAYGKTVSGAPIIPALVGYGGKSALVGNQVVQYSTVSPKPATPLASLPLTKVTKESLIPTLGQNIGSRTSGGIHYQIYKSSSGVITKVAM